MVLESLINPLKAEKKPWEMFFIGFFYTSVAVFLSMWIFRDYASLVMVFLTVMACTPLMYGTIKMEEKKDLEIDSERTLLKEHGRALKFFMFLFLGMTLAFTVWYMALPSDVSSSMFSIQTETISNINAKATDITGAYTHGAMGSFTRIFLNNIKVLIFCVLFAFVYGVGAIFILAWNASVIGVAIGNFVRAKIAALAIKAGFLKAGAYMGIGVLGVMKYATHGFWEVLAYFIAGLAGGIISIAVIRHDFGTNRFERILLDSSDLLIISIIILFFAALIEVFVTPVLF